METTETSREPQWCLVGNIVNKRVSGEKGQETKHGTKHFSPGTKIYAFPAQWGDGYEKVIVVGRHRGSKDFVTMVIRSDWVTNWRAKMIYNPEVLRRMQEGVCKFWAPQNWKNKTEVMKYLGGLKKDENEKREPQRLSSKHLNICAGMIFVVSQILLFIGLDSEKRPTTIPFCTAAMVCLVVSIIVFVVGLRRTALARHNDI